MIYCPSWEGLGFVLLGDAGTERPGRLRVAW